jgi:hypothetical protein
MGIVTRCHITQYHEDTAFPLTSLCTTILIGLDTFTDRFALKPIAFVSTAIGPNLDPKSFRLTLIPLPIIDLTVWKLTLARKELGFFPFTLEQSAVRQCLNAVASSFALNPFTVKCSPIRQNLLT